jgi:hypothetical protein
MALVSCSLPTVVNLTQQGRTDGRIYEAFLGYSEAICELVNRTKCRVAYVGIRGGGEKLDQWRKVCTQVIVVDPLSLTQAGILENEHHAVSDILAAASFFRSTHFDLALPKFSGHSNEAAFYSVSAGAHLGMLAVNRRPDAFDAVILRAGVYDMSRMHVYGNPSTIAGWKSQHGDIDNEAHRKWIPGLDPLQTINKHDGKAPPYKSILLDASIGDGTVPALHSLKQIAELQLTGKGTADG